MTNLIYWPIVVGAIAGETPAAHDPYFSSVVQLCHFDTNAGAGTPQVNSCPRGNALNNSASGNANTTTGPQWGVRSFGVTTSLGRSTASSHADYNFGANDWTVEFWINPDTLNRDFNTAKIYFDMRDSTLTAAWVPTISAADSVGNIKLFANGADRIVSAGNPIVAGVWQHVACCRVSGTTRLFVNGAQVGSNFADANTYVQKPMTVMAAANGGGACIGRMDDLRVTNGVGRYANNFAVPSAAFPNQ